MMEKFRYVHSICIYIGKISKFLPIIYLVFELCRLFVYISHSI